MEKLEASRKKVDKRAKILVVDNEILLQIVTTCKSYFNIFTTKIFRIILNGKTLLYSGLS